MSENLNDEILEADHQYRDGLPAFLNVLTILTFIGSGLGVLGGIYNIATPDQQQETINLMKSSPQVNPFGSDMVLSMQAMLDNLYVIQGSALLFAVMCIIGAVLMRKLKKSGYYLYLVASIGSIALPIAILGFGLMGKIILFGSVFTLAFVIMYSVNLKYLK